MGYEYKFNKSDTYWHYTDYKSVAKAYASKGGIYRKKVKPKSYPKTKGQYKYKRKRKMGLFGMF